MLVLSRKINEVIKVGEVIFRIVRLNHGRVRVGIQAPPHMRITRGDGPDEDGPSPDPEPTPTAPVPVGVVVNAQELSAAAC